MAIMKKSSDDKSTCRHRLQTEKQAGRSIKQEEEFFGDITIVISSDELCYPLTIHQLKQVM